ncbi:phage antirepressor KilAC domain-containing protein [Oceanimonas pelagia]|uniref:Phage antirepressor KilAC domain-containing protein n=1 Tax=Oceanimonas pelagia TaxID=3028314 RepID=A0AA50KQ98_9GAMM|nr:phage antirepressor KilAC domain-containing protein [Oceanimonas pelagia]WMC11729.1 phage antirepressor KilAC domain-containing protein [Oceanimonas pelagia]
MTELTLIAANAQPTMSSREIAELVESRHDKVKQSIERLADRGVIVRPPMGDEQKPDAMGRMRTESVYLINKRDSYVVVAQLSPEFTARLVDRWQELEAQSAFRIPQTLPEALRLAAEQAEQLEQQRALIEQQKPAVDFAKRIASAEKGVHLGNFAKSVGLGPRKVFDILREQRVLMTGGARHNLPYQEFVDRGYFTVRQSTYEANSEIRINHTPLITGKGEQWLTNRLISAGVLKAVAS